MILPMDLQEKINSLYSKINKQTLVASRQGLTDRYKQTKESGKSLIVSKEDSVVYAISRMPATYVVIYSLIDSLIKQGFIQDVSSVFDFGSGTGAGYFAVSDLFGDINIDLFERDENMINVFKQLSDGFTVNKFDFAKDSINKRADLVMTSYVLSEMNEETRILSVKKMLESSNKYVLLIDTGTPRTYENFLKIKKLINDNEEWHVVAPCNTEKCGLKNDYCQFYARVERSGLQRIAKDATLSYEDEKYFYLLLAKTKIENEFARVIRRPIIKTNITELKVCDKSGVRDVFVAKKNKELYKKSKKVKINELVDISEVN